MLFDLDLVGGHLLAAAQRELKTSGVSDTVRIALQHAAASSARARASGAGTYGFT